MSTSTLTPSTKILDHIVHLTPPGSVDATSEQFQKLGFKVIPGGTHADGLTANALVVFKDGVYLELISFTHPASYYPPGSPERTIRDKHPWAHKAPGWIDYAFLGNGSHKTRISDIINDRANKEGSGAIYLAEQDGGRTRPDGEVLKWLISAPKEQGKRGTQPFFCGDVTPRNLRVPSSPPSNVTHPSSAYGIAFIRILTASGAFTSLVKDLTSVIGHDPISSSDSKATWLLDTVNSSAENAPRLLLDLPSDNEQHQFVASAGTGIYEVGFRVERGKDGGPNATPYGKIAWVGEGSDA